MTQGICWASACITVTATENGVTKKLIFSGDLGNVDQPIIRDPSHFGGADYVVMESTYGNRNHTEVWSYTEDLAKIIDDTMAKGGNVVIPAFAVGRTQELLYFIREIKDKQLVKSNPDFPVYIDSPLAQPCHHHFHRRSATAIWMTTRWRWCRTAPTCSTSPTSA